MHPIIRQGLIAPGGVAAAAIVAWVVLGTGSALVVASIGAAAVIGCHLWQLARISDWAASALDSDVPEGRGVWAQLLAAIYRRVRIRTAYERDLRQIIDRFQQASPAIPDGIVVLDAGNRIDWANPRAPAQLGHDL